MFNEPLKSFGEFLDNPDLHFKYIVIAEESKNEWEAWIVESAGTIIGCARHNTLNEKWEVASSHINKEWQAIVVEGCTTNEQKNYVSNVLSVLKEQNNVNETSGLDLESAISRHGLRNILTEIATTISNKIPLARDEQQKDRAEMFVKELKKLASKAPKKD
jgi:hypothetical protein